VKNVTEIKRTGPPSARDVKGRVITWTLPLSAMPDKDWRQFFNQTKDTTITCTPKHVHMYQSMMVFESAEEEHARRARAGPRPQAAGAEREVQEPVAAAAQRGAVTTRPVSSPR
jgi:hypothetical protein